MRPALDLTFGLGGNAEPFQVSGWSFAEDGYTWAVGPESVLRAPLGAGEGDLLLDMTLRPFMIPPYRCGQRVGLRINGSGIGEERVQDDSALGFRIPAAAVQGSREIEITLLCPDAISPSETAFGDDPRKLSVRLRDLLSIWAAPEPVQTPRRLPPLPVGRDLNSPQTTELVRGFTGHAPDTLMLQFESQGANCEFGLVQRAFGSEPLRFLRFVGIDVQNLLSGLDFGFQGIDDPALVRIYTDGGNDAHYVFVNSRYAIHRHSYQHVNSMNEASCSDE